MASDEEDINLETGEIPLDFSDEENNERDGESSSYTTEPSIQNKKDHDQNYRGIGFEDVKKEMSHENRTYDWIPNASNGPEIDDYRTDNKPDDPKYGCSFCDKKFKSAFLLEEHMRIHIWGEETNVSKPASKKEKSPEVEYEYVARPKRAYRPHGTQYCDRCDRNFTTEPELSKHAYLVHGITHWCMLCDRYVDIEHSIFGHCLRHCIPSLYKCNACGIFASLWHLKTHMKQVHMQIRFRCTKCEKIFLAQRFLAKHMLRHEEEPKSISSMNLTPAKTGLPCPFCPKVFLNENYLEKHVESHIGSSVKIKEEKGVSTKKEPIHSASNKFMCNKCFRDQGSAAALREHINTGCSLKVETVELHAKYTPKNIYGTGRGLLDTSRTKVMLEDQKNMMPEKELNVKKSYMEKERRKKCSCCGNTFLSAELLQKHKAQKKGAKYACMGKKCPCCGKYFDSDEELQYHKFKMAEEQYLVNEICICYVCRDSFLDTAALYRHLKAEHPEDLAMINRMIKRSNEEDQADRCDYNKELTIEPKSNDDDDEMALNKDHNLVAQDRDIVNMEVHACATDQVLRGEKATINLRNETKVIGKKPLVSVYTAPSKIVEQKIITTTSDSKKLNLISCRVCERKFLLRSNYVVHLEIDHDIKESTPQDEYEIPRTERNSKKMTIEREVEEFDFGEMDKALKRRMVKFQPWYSQRKLGVKSDESSHSKSKQAKSGNITDKIIVPMSGTISPTVIEPFSENQSSTTVIEPIGEADSSTLVIEPVSETESSTSKSSVALTYTQTTGGKTSTLSCTRSIVRPLLSTSSVVSAENTYILPATPIITSPVVTVPSVPTIVASSVHSTMTPIIMQSPPIVPNPNIQTSYILSGQPGQISRSQILVPVTPAQASRLSMFQGNTIIYGGTNHQIIKTNSQVNAQILPVTGNVEIVSGEVSSRGQVVMPVTKRRRKDDLKPRQDVVNEAQIMLHEPMPKIVNTPNKTGVYRCSMCNDIFSSFDLRVKHVLESHGPAYECRSCKALLFSLHDVKSHNYLCHTVHMCGYCQAKFSTWSQLEAHVKDCCNEDKIPLQNDNLHNCEKCFASFRCTYDIKEHELTAHFRRVVYPCKYCPQTFSTKRRLFSHCSNTHGKYSVDEMRGLIADNQVKDAVKPRDPEESKNNYSCLWCLIDFSNSRLLVDHLRIHAEGGDDQPAICSICSESLPSNAALITHIKIHSPSLIKQSTQQETTKKGYVCTVCTHFFMSYTKYAQHYKKHQIAANKCHLCGQVYTEHKRLLNHMVSHIEDEIYTCGICGVKKKTESQIKLHANRKHKTVTSLCRTCAFVFPNNVYKEHRAMHGSKKLGSLRCNICKKTFKVLSQLYFHKIKHFLDGNQMYMCKTCSRVYVFKDSYISHIKISKRCQGSTTQEMIITCNICSDEFSDNREFLDHIEDHKHNRDPGAEHLQVCTMCCEVFMNNPRAFALHVTRHHEIPELSSPFGNCIECIHGFISDRDLVTHIVGVHGKPGIRK